MEHTNKPWVLILVSIFLFSSCDDGFLDRSPLSEPSSESFWSSAENAELWINDLYNGLPLPSEALLGVTEGASDNAWARTNAQIGKGAHTPSSSEVRFFWNYEFIRAGLTFLEKIGEVPGIDERTKGYLTGQAKFIIAYKYYELVTVYRDVPLVTKVMSISESDLPKSDKAEVLAYLIGQLDEAIALLPVSWPAQNAGRFNKGAALALKARVLLYNEKWAEAADAARQVMDLGVYKLHADFKQLFLTEYDNKNNEVILDRQFIPGLAVHTLYSAYGFSDLGGFASFQPTASLANSFEAIDGLPIGESLIYNAEKPMENRDPRFYETLVLPFQSVNDAYYDPINGSSALKGQIQTNLFFRKYVNDMKKGGAPSGKNWIIIRYADVLLMYAEAMNEHRGPDGTVYDAVDQVRIRAGMPRLDRHRYNSKEKLRNVIRNERRVELAGEGLRYFDIVRWKIAEGVMTGPLYSFDIPGVLASKVYDVRVFDPARHYIWPIPQFAIDNATKLIQHPEWK